MKLAEVAGKKPVTSEHLETLVVPSAGPPPQAVVSPSLTALIPTEVILFYSSVIGVLEGVVKSTPANSYVPLRWAIMLCGVIAVAVTVLIAFFRGKELGGKSFPTAMLTAVEVSFLAWAAIIPGSALYYVLKSPTLPVVIGIISATGVFLASVVFRPLAGAISDM
jgi:hypothetical protein